MYTIVNALLLGLVFLCSCREGTPAKGDATKGTDSPGRSDSNHNAIIAQKANPSKNDTDDLTVHVDSVLQVALEMAKKNIDKLHYAEDFKTASGNFPEINTQVAIGNFFLKTRRHLVIRSIPISGTVEINIYLVENGQFRPVLSHEEWDMTYMSDTIRDVNGDDQKDFLVNWYGSVGCCLKDFHDVYLVKADGSFSDSFEFINATFSPEEHIIRGVSYGHPGETSMYKFRWDGFNVDTVEYIRPNDDHKPGYILERRKPDGTFEKKKLRTVPKEYRHIYGYDWFMDNVS